jgi:hypothetical protein
MDVVHKGGTQHLRNQRAKWTTRRCNLESLVPIPIPGQTGSNKAVIPIPGQIGIPRFAANFPQISGNRQSGQFPDILPIPAQSGSGKSRVSTGRDGAGIGDFGVWPSVCCPGFNKLKVWSPLAGP